MKEKLLVIIGLSLLSALFVVLDSILHHHFYLHLAAIPLEIILAVIVVEHFLASKEKAIKKHQLFLIKSYLFRSEMKNLFVCSLISIKSPEIDIGKIRTMTFEELQVVRSDMGAITYRSPLHLEKVIQE